MEENCQLRIENSRLKSNKSHQDNLTRDNKTFKTTNANKPNCINTKSPREHAPGSKLQSHDRKATMTLNINKAQPTIQNININEEYKEAQQTLESQRIQCVNERRQKYELTTTLKRRVVSQCPLSKNSGLKALKSEAQTFTKPRADAKLISNEVEPTAMMSKQILMFVVKRPRVRVAILKMQSTLIMVALS